MPAVRPEEHPPLRSPSSVPPDTVRATAVHGVRVLELLRDRTLLWRLDGPDAGQTIRLGPDEVTFGRDPSCTHPIDGVGMSRLHARIVREGDAHVVVDLDSTNGTFVRGERVARAKLEEGDVIQLGPQATFRYTVTDARHEALIQQLFVSSTRDPLTGAYNRRHLDERLRAEISHAIRHGTELSVILFDIDHFKRINDEHGHAEGDAALKHVVHVGLGALRAEDVLARYGGEEFVIVLRGTLPAGAARAAERVLEALRSAPFECGGRDLHVTASAGVASLSEIPWPSSADLLAKADARLYAAKAAGRDRVHSQD